MAYYISLKKSMGEDIGFLREIQVIKYHTVLRDIKE
jgi:hypothetical protein